MARVDAAEKEASEVLHSLLSVERIEKRETTEGEIDDTSPYQTADDPDSQIQWRTTTDMPPHTLFTSIDTANQYSEGMEEHQVVIWEGHTIQVDPEAAQLGNIYTTEAAVTIEEQAKEDEEEEVVEKKTVKAKSPSKFPKKKVIIRKKKKGIEIPSNTDRTKLEDSASQVKERFKRGCECQDESCFRGLNPECVYKHRLNIAELTKGEHDMYLMGVTMACLANPDTTVRHKERRRLRAQYVYQGRRVCLDAFLYLENCTHYQLKRIRKHVMTHGVAPRVHGNHGKKPHNTFSLDIYRHATEFLKQYLEQQTGGEVGIGNSKQPIQLPWDITRKNLHDAYKEYGQILEPGVKLMGYSTFRHFMKEQFPHVKFCKVEPKAGVQTLQQNQQPQQIQAQVQQPDTTTHHLQVQQQQQTALKQALLSQTAQKCVINNEVQQVIPLVVAPNDNTAPQQHHQAFLVTPVPQIIQNGNVVQQNTNNHTGSNFAYQVANTSYVINEQGQIVTTMANAQHHTPYTFNRM